jgi:hypothetical protein
MSGDLDASPLLAPLLLLIFHRRITAPDSDTGLAELATSTDRAADVNDWRTAVADALQAGCIHDPVRLPAGALQCHWHLELTPKGVEMVRRLQAAKTDVR